jgi:hypothetical protein
MVCERIASNQDGHIYRPRHRKQQLKPAPGGFTVQTFTKRSVLSSQRIFQLISARSPGS